MELTRRKRAFLPKVKTGCQTCKYALLYMYPSEIEIPFSKSVCLPEPPNPEQEKSSVTKQNHSAADAQLLVKPVLAISPRVHLHQRSKLIVACPHG